MDGEAGSGTGDAQRLLDECEPLVRAVARKYGLASEDLFGGVAADILKSAHLVRAADNPEAYLNRLIHNAAKKLGQRAKASGGDEAVQGVAARDCPSAEEAAEKAERLLLLRDAIGQLPPAQRDAVMLVDVQGLEQKQAAMNLGKSYGALRRSLQEGRAKVRKALEGLVALIAALFGSRRALAATAGAIVLCALSLTLLRPPPPEPMEPAAAGDAADVVSATAVEPKAVRSSRSAERAEEPPRPTAMVMDPVNAHEQGALIAGRLFGPGAEGANVLLLARRVDAQAWFDAAVGFEAPGGAIEGVPFPFGPLLEEMGFQGPVLIGRTRSGASGDFRFGRTCPNAQWRRPSELLLVAEGREGGARRWAGAALIPADVRQVELLGDGRWRYAGSASLDLGEIPLDLGRRHVRVRPRWQDESTFVAFRAGDRPWLPVGAGVELRAGAAGEAVAPFYCSGSVQVAAFVAADHGFAAAWRTTTTAADALLEFGRPQPASTVVGRVVDARGLPGCFARVTVGLAVSQHPESTSPPTYYDLRLEVVRVVADDQGRFEAPGLAAGERYYLGANVHLAGSMAVGDPRRSEGVPPQLASVLETVAPEECGPDGLVLQLTQHGLPPSTSWAPRPGMATVAVWTGESMFDEQLTRQRLDKGSRLELDADLTSLLGKDPRWMMFPIR